MANESGKQIHVITAGDRPVVEVVVSEDGLVLTIRAADNHADKIDLPSSILSTLIRTLQKVKV